MAQHFDPSSIRIPEELKQLAQWVIAGQDKRPINPKTGGAASVTDMTTWADFQTAAAVANVSGLHIGFVLTKDDPYAIIDLDDKFDKPATPEQKSLHESILNHFQSYTERSISGRGFHIVVKGTLPTGVHRDTVEAYSSGRYMICTGDVVKPLAIAEYQSSLTNMYGQMKPASTVALEEFDSLLEDKELVEMAMNASNGDKFDRLCCGNWQTMGYPSQSEGDMALMSIIAYYTRSNEQARRLFRMSVLGKREKAQRPAYLNYMLQKIRANEPPAIDFTALAKQAEEISPQDPLTNAANALPPSVGQQTPLTPQISPPPGLIGNLTQYFYATANRPVLEVALVAALGLIAGVAGRAYHTNGDPTGLGLLLTVIAETGTGKEGGKQGINRLLASVRPQLPMVDRFIGPTAFASGQALVKRFSDQPSFVAILDEFGHLVKRITSAKASSSEQSLHLEVLALYSRSGPNGSIGVQAYSDKEKNTVAVRAPNLTIVGESTPDVFFGSLDSALVQDGLVPRLLVVEYKGKRPPSNPQAGGKPSDILIKRFAELVTIALAAEQNGSFSEVQQDSQAKNLLDSFDKCCDDLINNSSSTERQLWNRAHLNAIKVAALVAVGCNPHSPVVTAEAAEWAVAFVRRSVGTVLSRFESGETGGSDYSKGDAEIRKRIKVFLSMDEVQRSNPNLGIPKSMRSGGVIPRNYLNKRLRDVQPFKSNPRLLDEVLREMVKADTLKQLGGPEKTKYNTTGDAYVVGENW